MEKPYILHLFTPMAQASPFDINMAYDAGYDGVVPYTHVELEQVAALTQDTIFSRGPKGAKRTGIFIGGRDNGLAADMLDGARKAMVPPFEVSVFVDPSGAFTTAAAMVAAVEKHLKKTQTTDLNGKRVMIFGGSGPVGAAAAVLAAQAGAKVGIVGREESSRACLTAEDCNRRYGTHVEPVEANTEALKLAMMQQADVVLATARAGHRVVTKELLAAAPRLLVAADVNAVPPTGIEGIGPMDDGAPLAAGSRRAVGIGALAIGNIKYQTQRGLLEMMLKAEKPVYLDMRDAFTEARKYAGTA
ncbi:MAG TPA: NAD(P)-dependent methylenetetrahydromethanopterin dehydrogenase [Burkholderiales bacterium]|jgi:methylene-tetrahydromethanopterin dehydrogenase|nr:NAD(P)-dependent methylenetetrahydromethanopterin dehydrogenase [Burkholderiales bacterium]